MQPSYALLPDTSYPKTVGGMCYAIIELILIGLKQPLVTSQSKAREARHTIPACIVQTSYPRMQSPNHRPGKLETLSQQAVMTNHKSGKSYMLSQHA